MSDVLAEGADTGEAAVQGVEEAAASAMITADTGDTTISYYPADGEILFVPAPPPSDEPIVMGRASLPLEPGKPCPTCGKPYGKSQAQRSREWRAKRKEEAQ